MLKGDIIINVILIFTYIYLFVETFKFEALSVYGKLGPAYWPRFLLSCLICFSIGTIIETVFKMRKRYRADESFVLDRGKIKLFTAIALIVSYFILMKVVGFIIVTPVFMIAFMVLLGEKSKPWMFSVSIGITAVIIILFMKAMYVPLPRGIGIFLKLSYLLY